MHRNEGRVVSTARSRSTAKDHEAGADLVGQALAGMFGAPVDHAALAYRPGVYLTKYTETLAAGPRPPPSSVNRCHKPGWCLVCEGKPYAEGQIMRVLATGATGAVGRRLVRMLIEAGHEVTATTRTPGKVAPFWKEGFRAWVAG